MRFEIGTTICLLLVLQHAATVTSQSSSSSHNDSTCHILLPEHCHCRTAINYTSEAQRNACKYFYPVSFGFIGSALGLMLLQVIVIFCVFAPALKRRSIQHAISAEEVRCEHCDHRLELLMHQLDDDQKYTCIACKLEHRIALALGSLVCEVMTLVCFEICWLFALRNFLTLLSAFATVFFFAFSAWAVGDGFFRYYCYMTADERGRSIFSPWFPVTPDTALHSPRLQQQFDAGDLILPDHFPQPISAIPSRQNETILFWSDPPRPQRLRAFALHLTACWIIIIAVPLCVSALEFKYGETVLLTLLLWPPLLFCCFLTTLYMVPSLRAYLVLTNERLIVLYPAMFGRHKVTSYSLQTIRSAAVVSVASPLNLHLLIWRSKSNVSNGILVVTRSQQLSDALQPLLPPSDVRSGHGLLTLDHAVETSAQCARCCSVTFPVLSLIFFAVPPVCLLVGNAEIFVATLPCWFCIYFVWLLRSLVQNSKTTVLKSSRAPLRRSSSRSNPNSPKSPASPVPEVIAHPKNEEENDNGGTAAIKRAASLDSLRRTADVESDHDDNEDDDEILRHRQGRSAMELAPRRVNDNESKSGPAEELSLLKHTAP